MIDMAKGAPWRGTEHPGMEGIRMKRMDMGGLGRVGGFEDRF